MFSTSAEPITSYKVTESLLRRFHVLVFTLCTASGIVASPSALAEDEISPQSNQRAHVITDQFDDWRVRHYFDQDSLRHRFSDAKSVIVTGDGQAIPFQFNRRANDNDYPNSIIIPGWIWRVIFVIDGEPLVFEDRPTMHNLYLSIEQDIARSFAMAQAPIEVEITYSGPSGSKVSGVLSPIGTAAALRWIRMID